MSIYLKSLTLLILAALANFLLADASLFITARSESTNAPLMFIENVGQFDERAAFLVRGSQGAVWLVEDGLWLTLVDDTVGVPHAGARRGVHLKLTFVGANPHPRFEPFNRLETVIPNFHARRAGQEGVLMPVWGGVRYVDLYPGFDLELSGQNGRLRPRLICHKGAACRTQSDQKIQLRIEGADEEPQTGWLDQQGIHLPVQSPSLSPCHLVTLSPCHPATSPSPHGLDELAFSTYIGDELWEEGDAIVVDAHGNSYITGYTSSLEFPAASSPFMGQHGIDVYVVKLRADGSALDYVIWVNAQTLFAEDYGKAIAVDDTGSVYVVGQTDSDDFCAYFGSIPGYDTSYNQNNDAFAFKVQPDGIDLDYCTFLGGEEWDVARAVAVDDAGRATITGGTWSDDFPTEPDNPYDSGFNGLRDVFALRLSAAGTALEYSSYLGGTSQEEAAAIALDDDGSATLTGWTFSADFPATASSYDRNYNGAVDAFVAKFNAGGTGLVYATYLGGSAEDRGASLAMAGNGAVYLTGRTLSTDFPTSPGAFDPAHGGSEDDCAFPPCLDAFVAVLSASGAQLNYGTFLGGDHDDEGFAIALNPAGGVYLTGVTYSDNFPTTAGAFDTILNGDRDAFVTQLNSTGSGLPYSTYLGGSNSDEGLGLASDAWGDVFVTGRTFSDDFPTTDGAYSRFRSGDYDIFVSQLDIGSGVEPTPTPSMTFTPGPSPTPTPTFTASPTGSPTSTATPSSTPMPGPSPTATPTSGAFPAQFWNYIPEIRRD